MNEYQRERYKHDGKCPDCGEALDVEVEQLKKINSRRRVDFDCHSCGYWAEGYLKPYEHDGQAIIFRETKAPERKTETTEA